MPEQSTSPTPALPGETAPVQHAGDQSAAEMARELDELRTTLADTREALWAAERQREIERELTSHGAIDLETASLLTERAVEAMTDADVSQAVRELKRRKPFLFQGAPASRSSAMSGEAPPRPPLLDAEAQARQSGDRRALMRYLRLRRGH